MKHKIYRYPLEIKRKQILSLPRNSSVVCVKMLNCGACLWARVPVDEKKKTEPVSVHMIKTGEEFDNPGTLLYLDTLTVFPKPKKDMCATEVMGIVPVMHHVYISVIPTTRGSG